MSRDQLMEEFADYSPKRLVKKQSNSEIGNLLSMQFQFSKPKPIEISKKKLKQQTKHEYLIQAEKGNQKVKKNIEKIMIEKSMSVEQLRHRKHIESITNKFEKAKKQADRSLTTLKKKYMPTIVDPFSKVKKDQKVDQKAKTKTSNSSDRNPFKKIHESAKNASIASKKQQKVQKIERKEKPIQVKEKQREGVPKAKEPNVLKPNQVKIKQKRQSKSSSSSSSSSSSGSSSGPEHQSNESDDWRKQLRKITKYDPKAKKFQARDRQQILESGVDKMFREDKISHKLGILQQEQDFRRQLQHQKRRKEKKHKKHHRNH